MSVAIKPLEDRIVIKQVEAEQTTASGLVIPDTAKEKPQEGVVVAVGPGRIDDNGNRVPLDIAEGDKGSAVFVLPFDPDKAWGKKSRHRVSGTVDGEKIRATIDTKDRLVVLGPMWRRDAGVNTGAKASIELWPEGPQQSDLAEDFLAALKAEPKALAFFDDLAQFYRKAYLTWINGTKRRPDERVRRIRETVKLLKAGKKERPK